MSAKAQKAGVNRRKFLLGAGAGATAVAAAELVSAPAAQAMNPGPDETKSRYRLSDEVKTFYRVNGYEGRK
jgi:hypothetical protein